MGGGAGSPDWAAVASPVAAVTVAVAVAATAADTVAAAVGFSRFPGSQACSPAYSAAATSCHLAFA